jgi:hypothetical protein
MSGAALSRHAVVGGGAFPGCAKHPDLIFDVVLTSGYLCDRIIHGEARFYQGVLILYQSYHGDYACLLGRAAMSDNDGMDSTTRVHAVRRAWALVATSCHAQAINVTIF